MELKISPEYFKPVLNEEKTFEVRKNDRNFFVGEVINLREYDKSHYTGRSVLIEITYILDDSEYCKDGYIIFSFNLVFDTLGRYDRCQE